MVVIYFFGVGGGGAKCMTFQNKHCKIFFISVLHSLSATMNEEVHQCNWITNRIFISRFITETH